MPVRTQITPAIDPKQRASLTVGDAINQIRAAKTVISDPLQRVLKQMSDALDRHEQALKNDSIDFGRIAITDASGALIAWIGPRVMGGVAYNGGGFAQLWVGPGADPSQAPFFVDNSGQLTIGQNGAILIKDIGGNVNGFLGIKSEASKTISSVGNNGGSIQFTVTGHGYQNGDSVFVSGVLGVPGANGDFDTITIDDANHFTVPIGFTGAYTGGGTVFRYFGEIWAKRALFGGVDNTNAVVVIDSAGNIVTSQQIKIGAAGIYSVILQTAGLTVTGSGFTAVVSSSQFTVDDGGSNHTFIDAGGLQTTGNVEAATYSVGGVSGVDKTFSGVGVVSMGTAVTSVDFVGQTTTSGSFVTAVGTIGVQVSKGIVTF